jgi:hypothetical protein
LRFLVSAFRWFGGRLTSQKENVSTAESIKSQPLGAHHGWKERPAKYLKQKPK